MVSDELLSLRQMANRYGVSRETVRRWRREGLLPKPDVLRPRKRWSRAALERWEHLKNMATKASK